MLQSKSVTRIDLQSSFAFTPGSGSPPRPPPPPPPMILCSTESQWGGSEVAQQTVHNNSFEAALQEAERLIMCWKMPS